MKRIYTFLTSMPFMAFLFVIISIAMGIATFIESSQGAVTARALVYNSIWFEVIWGLLALNLLNNIFKYRLFQRKKYSVGIFHISFLVILLGSFITRYFSFEGTMHIREGKNSTSILTTDDYFYAATQSDKKETKVRFSEMTKNRLNLNLDNNGAKVKVAVTGFISNAESKPIPSESGVPVIEFVYTSMSGGGMQSFVLEQGNSLDLPGFSAGFETGSENTIRFFRNGSQLFMSSPLQIAETNMTSQQSFQYGAGDTVEVKIKVLYALGNFRFLIRNYLPSATFMAVRSEQMTNQDAVLVDVTEGTQKHTVSVFGRSGAVSDTVSIELEKGKLDLAYGAMQKPVPFGLYLRDFQLDRYPGSESPSSYASEVTLIDNESGVKKDIRIYMNNTLTHKGYKFFQSSYDTDEKGTVLSVNHDFWGTLITYLGYALMILGMLFALISPKSHFAALAKRLKEHSAKSMVVLILLASPFVSFSQPGNGSAIPGIDKGLVNQFSKLWVQGVDGRIEPLSTLNNELVRKISRKSTLYGRSADEVILSMMTYPEKWREMPIIKISNGTLAEQLGANGKFVTFNQLFDNNGHYKITSQVQEAYNKAPALRNRVEKEYLYLDEKVNICYMIYESTVFHLFPRAQKTDTWYSPGSKATEYSGGDSLFISSGINYLVQSISEGNAKDASQTIQAILNFQVKYGKSLIPSESSKKIEILYNTINPFKRVFPFYLAFGFILLTVLFINIFREKPLPSLVGNSLIAILLVAFALHTLGLGLRWYISGHAPWSNGFESIVYVAWATMLAGLIFGRKYKIVIGTAALLSGIALFVAHLSWMNPEVTPLVPVLKSYWLTIHVAVITASYGFIGLSAFLGIMVLIFVILRKQQNAEKIRVYMNQLTTINEMSATVGLYFLTIGTFLGGIWANESWGRYWGWDPKETWSLITICVYSFVVHMRLIPGLKGIFNYNVASVLGFFSVLMTYFGVNYYLTGLHSYGKGSADGISTAILVTLAVLVLLMAFAWYRDYKFEKETQPK